MRRSPVHAVLAVAYVAALVAIACWPTPVDRGVDVLDSWPVRWLESSCGLPRPTGYDVVQTAANVVLFVPLGWFAVALTRLTWWQVTVAGLVASVTIELGQAWLRPERFATASDVVANTSGALIGALAASAVLRRRTGVQP